MRFIKVIPDGHVYVTPEPFDIKYDLEPLLKQSPFQNSRVNADTLRVTLCKSDKTIVKPASAPKFPFTATVTGCNIRLGKGLVRELVLTLESTDLQNRYLEYLRNNPTLPGYYEPYLVIESHLPPNKPSTRWWVNNMLHRFNPRPEGHQEGGEGVGMKIRFVEEHTGPTLEK